MTRSTQDLLSSLSSDLTPVRRVPPLRVSAGIVLTLWALAVEIEWRMGGARPAFGDAGRWHDPIYTVLFSGLVIAGGAGLVAGLAHRIPGREELARLAGQTVLAGAVIAIGAVAAGFLQGGSGPMPSMAMAWSCVWRSATLAVVPALVTGWLLRGSWVTGASRAGPWVPAFALPLGAVAVHASCTEGGAMHMLLGHVAGPLLIGGALAFLWRWLGVRRSAAS